MESKTEIELKPNSIFVHTQHQTGLFKPVSSSVYIQSQTGTFKPVSTAVSAKNQTGSLKPVSTAVRTRKQTSFLKPVSNSVYTPQQTSLHKPVPYEKCITNILKDLMDSTKDISDTVFMNDYETGFETDTVKPESRDQLIRKAVSILRHGSLRSTRSLTNRTNNGSNLLNQFQTGLTELHSLMEVFLNIDAEQHHKHNSVLERAKAKAKKQEEEIEKLQQEYQQEVTNRQAKFLVKTAEIDHLQSHVDHLMDIRNGHLESIKSEADENKTKMETDHMKVQEKLTDEIQCLKMTFEEQRALNEEKEQDLSQTRCFTQTALEELMAHREKEILQRKNTLNMLDIEYRRQERGLKDLQNKIHKVEEELDEIKQLRQQEVEKKQERRRKLKDVFRTWIRVRFAFQQH